MAKEGMWEMMQSTKIIQSIKLAGNIELVHQVLQIKYRIRTPTNPENHNDTEGTYFPENIALLQKRTIGTIHF